MSNVMESTEEIVKFVSEHAGLNKFNLQLTRLPSFAYRLSLMGHFSFDLNPAPTELFKKQIVEAIQPLLADIRSSDMVKELVRPYQNTIDRLENELADAKKQIEELTLYKNHFEIEMRLRHGK